VAEPRIQVELTASFIERLESIDSVEELRRRIEVVKRHSLRDQSERR
jgi:hypothetical protein